MAGHTKRGRDRSGYVVNGHCVDVLKRVKSFIGRYKDVIQPWVFGCDGHPGYFLTMDALCRLLLRSPNDPARTCPEFLSLFSRLLLIPDHSRCFGPFKTVRNISTKFTDHSGSSKTHSRSFPTSPSLRLHKTSPDHQGRERSAFRSDVRYRWLKGQYRIGMLNFGKPCTCSWIANFWRIHRRTLPVLERPVSRWHIWFRQTILLNNKFVRITYMHDTGTWRERQYHSGMFFDKPYSWEKNYITYKTAIMVYE